MTLDRRRFALLALAALGLAAPVAAEEPRRPVRVLLLAGGPTREFQICRRFFAQETDRQQAELSVLLQGADPEQVAATAAEKWMKALPGNLPVHYDVVIAFDPDWLQLTAEQRGALEEWVRRDGGGLVLIAGAVHTYQLARPVNREGLKPIRDLYPVEPRDARVHPTDERATRYPRSLRFVAASLPAFLKLDDQGKNPAAGWDEFFSAGQRARFKEGKAERIEELIADLDSDGFEKREKAFTELRTIGLPALPALEKVLRGKPSLEVSRRVEKLLVYIQLLDVGRGFYDHYPVERVKPAATVVANLTDPELQPEQGEQPYLVTMPHGAGRVVYLGSGEMWRLRPFREAYYERFWRELARYAAANRP